jgi:hypothetical protein
MNGTQRDALRALMIGTLVVVAVFLVVFAIVALHLNWGLLVIGGLGAMIPALVLQSIVLGLFGIYREDSGSPEHFTIHWWLEKGAGEDDPNVDKLIPTYFAAWAIVGMAITSLFCRGLIV